METTEKNMEHGEHFNESIVNEVILEDMKKNRIDHMKYLPGMEVLEESDVMDQVISAMNAYDYDKYTEADVRRALAHDRWIVVHTPNSFHSQQIHICPIIIEFESSPMSLLLTLQLVFLQIPVW